MKEEFENDTVDVEQLLRSKSWDELNADERSAARELFTNEGEYDRVRAMMQDLRSGSGIEEEELQPSKTTRTNLLAAFDDEQRRRRVLWWNGLGFWFRDQLRLDIPAVRYAIAGVVLIVGIVAVMQLNFSNNNSLPPIAKKDNVQPGQSPLHQDESKDQLVNDDKTEPLKQEENNTSPSENNKQIIPSLNQVPQQVVQGSNNQPSNVQGTSNGFNPYIDGNSPVVIDTSSQRLAMNPGSDTATLVSPTVTFTNGSAICVGSNNANITASGGTPAYTYTWNLTPTDGTSPLPTNGNITGIYTVVVPNCRSLANDEKVIGAMFSMK